MGIMFASRKTNQNNVERHLAPFYGLLIINRLFLFHQMLIDILNRDICLLFKKIGHIC